MDLEKEALGKLKRILKYKDNNDALAIRIMEQYFFDKQEQQLSLAAVSKSVT